MKAADARKLEVGDYVMAGFGNVSKRCEIIGINWPKFGLKTTDYKGRPMYRDRNYRSLWASAEQPKARPAPFWLTWPECGS